MAQTERTIAISEHSLDLVAATLQKVQGKNSQDEAGLSGFARMAALVDGITSARGFAKLRNDLVLDADNLAVELMAHMDCAGAIPHEKTDHEVAEIRQSAIVKQLTAAIGVAITQLSPIERHGAPLCRCSNITWFGPREQYQQNYILAIFGADGVKPARSLDAAQEPDSIKNSYAVRSTIRMNAVSAIRMAIYGDDAKTQQAHFAMATLIFKKRAEALEAVEPSLEKREALRLELEEQDRLNEAAFAEVLKGITGSAEQKHADQAQQAHERALQKAKSDQKRVEQVAAERQTRWGKPKPCEMKSTASAKAGSESELQAVQTPAIERQVPVGQTGQEIHLTCAWVEAASWCGQVIVGEDQDLLAGCTAWALNLVKGANEPLADTQVDWEDKEQRRRVRIRLAGGASVIERVEPIDHVVSMRTTVEVTAGTCAGIFDVVAKWHLRASQPMRSVGEQIDNMAHELLAAIYQSGTVLRDRRIHKCGGHYPDGTTVNDMAALICSADRLAPVIVIRAAAARQTAVEKWISRSGHWAHVTIVRTHAVAAKCAEVTGQGAVQQEGSVVIYSRIESGRLRMQTYGLDLDEISSVVAVSRVNRETAGQASRIWAVPTNESNGDDGVHAQALRGTLEELEAAKAIVSQLGMELQTLKQERADWVGAKMVADAQIKGLLERNAELETKVRNMRPSVESWGDLEEWVIQAMSARVVLTKKAMAAAKRSVYRDFDFAADVIDLLGTDYRDMRMGKPGAYEKTEARKAQLGVKIGPCGEAPTSRNYGEEYRVAWGKRTYRLDLHVQGSSARERERGFRLYFAWDDERHVVVVGSMPEHLTIYAS
ncbi:hypothetical protein [Metallibacterium scheffleri]|uniref:Uncharacterized protein n=1 Tax=Metallibacterium scheffleri TaxID=993689 RepID=A0A4S3KMV4_9GAMM|nr:hypothetical protein [Metallibacterium scheffleri]THD10090.1 hypothetical protein B1806_09475 [Metallibacterium scheffleri]